VSDIYSAQFLIVFALGLLATGAISGVLAGLLGVGGGIVIVPVLFLLAGFLGLPAELAMPMAVGTSLATIIPTSISSARSHRKRGSVDAQLLKSWAPAVFVGALIGGVLASVVSGAFLTVLFGVVALLVAINLALPRTVVLAEDLPKGVAARTAVPTAIGILSALMGIGGGTLSVPILSAFSFPVHRAIGTAAALGIVIAVPAVFGFIWAGWDMGARPPYSLGYVSLPAAVLIFTTSVFTAPMGSQLAHSLDARVLKPVFALFLFVTSLRMLWQAFGRGFF
jgi:uncharacterized membrane protein YfcA